MSTTIESWFGGEGSDSFRLFRSLSFVLIGGEVVFFQFWRSLAILALLAVLSALITKNHLHRRLQFNHLQRALFPVMLPADNQIAFLRRVSVKRKISALVF